MQPAQAAFLLPSVRQHRGTHSGRTRVPSNTPLTLGAATVTARPFGGVLKCDFGSAGVKGFDILGCVLSTAAH